MTRQFWNPDEIALLTRLYPTTLARDIAPHLPGRSAKQIECKAWKLGLERTIDAQRPRRHRPSAVPEEASLPEPHHGAHVVIHRPGVIVTRHTLRG